MIELTPSTISSRRRYALLILGVLLFIPLGAFLYIQNKWIIEPLPLGSRIPSVDVTTLDGKTVKIDSLITRKALIVFFSTTCPHCRIELKILDSLHQKFKNDFEIIVLSLSTQEETKKYVDELRIPFTTYFDKTLDAKRQFRVMPVPAMFFINQQKQLVKYNAGEESKELLYPTLLKFALLSSDSLFFSL